MPEVEGFIQTTQEGTHFLATFVIKDAEYNFSGRISSNTQQWKCKPAFLEYETLAQLTSTRPFDGKIGRRKVELKISNGPKIVGYVLLPLEEGSSVSGNGMWNTGARMQ
ncbi:hypothetical protein CPB83DRAFT_843599 [Crepidotus variabilis]|uniref:Uncharacterized protein n=1 Tax=Crepidotus variabilis TaxID=179855 RepID=A0A9P6JW40_9AGAR|nr:hypothetical protein CPB83DRAFT_843599 [Crepidotus variabilis]